MAINATALGSAGIRCDCVDFSGEQALFEARKQDISNAGQRVNVNAPMTQA